MDWSDAAVFGRCLVPTPFVDAYGRASEERRGRWRQSGCVHGRALCGCATCSIRLVDHVTQPRVTACHHPSPHFTPLSNNTLFFVRQVVFIDHAHVSAASSSTVALHGPGRSGGAAAVRPTLTVAQLRP